MKYLDLSLPTPELNLACDEALLNWCEEGAGEEILRFWESSVPFVVLGYANQVAREVYFDVCQQEQIPVLRRCTGGGTVVQGPGCLNYSLLLQVNEAGPVASITGANQFIMQRHCQLLQQLLHAPVSVQGHTDLALHGQKFSGNAQRRRRRFLLFHGTFLVSFDLPLIPRLLPMPSKQPDYRADRAHATFISNIPLSSTALKCGLRQTWDATDALLSWPASAVQRLAEEKYARAEWNLRF
jgi:lipoate-protein ligase A